MTEAKKHLYNLNELSDYKVSDGYSNIQGWNIKDRDNRVIGKVDNLLVNLDAQRVVYLDVEVDKTIIEANYDPYSPSNNPNVKEFINKDGENHIIIPIGMVNINDEQKFVYTDTVDYHTFAETKRYNNNNERGVSRDYEVAVLDSYSRSKDQNLIDEDQVRKIVKEEVSSLNVVNKKETEYKEENKLREIVRDEVKNNQVTHSTDSNGKQSSNIHDLKDNEQLEAKRERLHRDDFQRTNANKAERGIDFDHDNDNNPNITDKDYYREKKDKTKSLDFDHDNDGNPNITDPDYYREKKDRSKSLDFDHDNDGNPNITDPDYYESKGEKFRKMDFDHDNDGNPNITDPDYYREKLGSKKDRDNDGIPDGKDSDTYDAELEKRRRNSDVYDDDDFYDRREFNDSKFRGK